MLQRVRHHLAPICLKDKWCHVCPGIFLGLELVLRFMINHIMFRLACSSEPGTACEERLQIRKHNAKRTLKKIEQQLKLAIVRGIIIILEVKCLPEVIIVCVLVSLSLMLTMSPELWETRFPTYSVILWCRLSVNHWNPCWMQAFRVCVPLLPSVNLAANYTRLASLWSSSTPPPKFICHLLITELLNVSPTLLRSSPSG